MSESIVITGAGVVTCLGLDIVSTWRRLCECREGLGPLTAMEQPSLPGKDGGQAPPLPGEFLPGETREVRYLAWAIQASLAMAQLTDAPPGARRRWCVVMGTTLHGMPAGGRFFRRDDPAALDAFLAASVLARAAEAAGVGGMSVTTCSACASGLSSVGLALSLLRAGEADVAIVGGYDPLSEYSYAGFNSLRLMSPAPSKPFCRDRQGLRLGEGYAAMILEREPEARRRLKGGRGFVRVRGQGESSDAHHLTQPHPQGAGAARAIAAALAQAETVPAQVDLIAGHATATPDNDGAEFLALRQAFGPALEATPCVAFKSHLGHTLGGAGAVELVLTATAMQTGLIPPTRNVTRDAMEFPELQMQLGMARGADLRRSLNVSLGFGGSNASVVLERIRRRPREAPEVPASTVLPYVTPDDPAAYWKRFAPSVFTPFVPPRGREVYITGVGVVAPGAVGNDRFVERVAGGSGRPLLADTGGISDEELLPLVASRRVRRMSGYVKLTLAAATIACRDAGVAEDAGWMDSAAAMLGSCHGSVTFSAECYAQVIREGLLAANPLLFAESVPNAGAAQLSLMLGLKGPCQTILGSRTAGLDALHLAWLRIRTGEWERAIVCAADEYDALTNRAYRHFGLHAPEGVAAGPLTREGFFTGAGAAAIILESDAAAKARGARTRARLDACAGATFPFRRPASAARRMAAMLESIDCPSDVVASPDATWLGRAELAGLASGHARRGPRTVGALLGHLAEAFSFGPLASLAYPVLAGRLPRLCGASAGTLPRFRPATGEERPASLAVTAADFNGPLAACRVTLDFPR